MDEGLSLRAYDKLHRDEKNWISEKLVWLNFGSLQAFGRLRSERNKQNWLVSHITIVYFLLCNVYTVVGCHSLIVLRKENLCDFPTCFDIVSFTFFVISYFCYCFIMSFIRIYFHQSGAICSYSKYSFVNYVLLAISSLILLLYI